MLRHRVGFASAWSSVPEVERSSTL